MIRIGIPVHQASAFQADDELAHRLRRDEGGAGELRRRQPVVAREHGQCRVRDRADTGRAKQLVERVTDRQPRLLDRIQQRRVLPSPGTVHPRARRRREVDLRQSPHSPTP